MPILRIVSGPHTGQQVLLKDGTAEIGRDPGCAIPLPQDNGVSRCHARLELSGGRLILHDLDSSNGLFVNDKRTASTLLQLGDRLQLGNSVLVVEGDPAEAPAPIPPEIGVVQAPSYATSAPSPGGAAYGGLAGSPPAPLGPAAGMAGSGYHAPGSGVANAWWLYFLAFSFPPLGLIIGIIYLRKDLPDEKRAGWWIIAWSVIGGILTWMSYAEFMKIWPTVQTMLSGGGAMKGLLGGDGS